MSHVHQYGSHVHTLGVYRSNSRRALSVTAQTLLVGATLVLPTLDAYWLDAVNSLVEAYQRMLLVSGEQTRLVLYF